MESGLTKVPGKHLVFWPIGLVFLVALSYIPILSVPPISDDYYFLSSKFATSPWRYFWSDIFPEDPAADFLRPIPAVSFVMEGRLPALIPVLSHAVNLLLHLLNVVLLYLILRYPSRRDHRVAVGSLVACVFFGLHPQNTGAVCWISARFDSYCLFFGVLGLNMWLVDRNGPAKRRILALILLLLAVLSKETGLLFPIALVISEAGMFVRSGTILNTRVHLYKVLPLIGLILIYLCFRSTCLGGAGGYSNLKVTDFCWQAVVGYTLVMVWPFGNMGPLPWLWFYVLTFVALCLLCTWVAVRPPDQPGEIKKAKGRCLGPRLAMLVCVLVLALLGLGPMTLFQILQHAESRYSYIPVFFFSIIIAHLIARVPSVRWNRVLVVIVLFIFLAPFLWAQQLEISRWRAAGIRASSIIEHVMVQRELDKSTLPLRDFCWLRQTCL